MNEKGYGRTWRTVCWVVAGASALIGLMLSLGDWTNRLALPDGAMGWLMVVVIMFGQVGYWVGKPQPQVVQLADLNAIRKAFDTFTAQVRTGLDELRSDIEAMAKDNAASYVDLVNQFEAHLKGHNGLRLVREPDRGGKG